MPILKETFPGLLLEQYEFELESGFRDCLRACEEPAESFPCLPGARQYCWRAWSRWDVSWSGGSKLLEESSSADVFDGSYKGAVGFLDLIVVPFLAVVVCVGCRSWDVVIVVLPEVGRAGPVQEVKGPVAVVLS